MTTPTRDPSEMSWEDIRALVASLALQSQETDRRLQETDRLIRELRESNRESSREFDRRMQETERLIRELRESGRETDRRMQETDRRMQETDRRLRELSRQIAGLGDKFGYFAEGLALPSLERILETRFGMETINPRVRVRRSGREQEYDVLAWANGEVNMAVIVEVKSRVKREAIAQLIEQLKALPQMIPELAGKARVGILAGIDWDPGVMQEAQAAGLYTATIHDEVFELTTPEGFTPRRW